MVTVKDVESAKLIAKVKEELKKINEVKPLEWSKFSKSGTSRNRPPIQPDFWYIRAASLLRRIYIDGPVGTSKLRTYYGGRKRRGHKPAEFRKSSGNILRKILQQLEAAGFVKKDKKGRIITSKGQRFLNKIAYELSR